MSFSKITLEKPIPVSPLIALDRERCILCYRCTRFSSDVAEDDQLVARNRGAHTEIATFGDDPYRAPFSGNVIELCPVGALTSTQYRFEARPVGHPERADRVRPLPRRLQRPRDGARGQGQARPLAQPPRGRRRLALRQGPLHLSRTSRPRTGSPSRSSAARLGLEPVAWDAALDRAEALLRDAGDPHRDRALRLRDDRAGLRARPRSCAAGSARTRPCCPSRPPTRSTPSGCRSRRSPTPRSSSSSATTTSPTARPSSTSGSKAARAQRRRDRPLRPDAARCRPGPAAPRPRCARSSSRATSSASGSARPSAAILVWSGSGGGGGARLAEAAHALGFEGKPGCGAFHLPGDAERPRRRGGLGGRGRRGRGEPRSRSAC